MALDLSERETQDRQVILRGVYEDNLRTVNKQGPRPARLRPVRRARVQPSYRPPRVVLLMSVFLVVAGFLYQGLQGEGAAQRGDREGPAGAEGEAGRMAPRSVVPGVRAASAPVRPSVVQDLPLANLTVANLYGLHVRTIVIDPGHGGSDPGTMGQLGTMEKDIALDVAHRLKARLERQHGYQVLMTREGDEKMSLRERIAFANAALADLFISIHVNWLPVDTVNSVETYYFGVQGDESALRLARRENANSEYSVAEFQEMVQKLSSTVKLEESRGVAVSIQRSLYRNMRKISENVSDWGVKTAPFMVLLGVEAPSVLAEIACISNRAAEAQLNTGEHREKLAMFLEEGIINYLKERPTTNASTERATAYATTEKD